MKKVSIGAKPGTGARLVHADDWVQARGGVVEPMKRLTIDVPLSLHTRIKSQCAIQNQQMADVIRDLLEKRFPG
jgi:hypothetical protein